MGSERGLWWAQALGEVPSTPKSLGELAWALQRPLPRHAPACPSLSEGSQARTLSSPSPSPKQQD